MGEFETYSKESSQDVYLENRAVLCPDDKKTNRRTQNLFSNFFSVQSIAPVFHLDGHCFPHVSVHCIP